MITHAEQGSAPQKYSLAVLGAASVSGLSRSPALPGFPDCYVGFSWSDPEAPPVVHEGEGSLVVAR